MSSDIGQPIYKLGVATNASGSVVPWQHRNVYERSTRNGVPVVVIGKTSDHVGMIQGLLDSMTEPLWVMYALLVPRGLGGEAAGRYSSNHAIPKDLVRDFFNANYDFFETDARHQIWVSSDPHRSEMLVWDQRDRIFAYGPVDDFEATCRYSGLTAGPVEFPPGLTPSYGAVFDADERRIISGQDLAWSWTKSPLQPTDLE